MLVEAGLNKINQAMLGLRTDSLRYIKLFNLRQYYCCVSWTKTKAPVYLADYINSSMTTDWDKRGDSSHIAVTILNAHITNMGAKRRHVSGGRNQWFNLEGKHPIVWYPLSVSKIPNDEQRELIYKHIFSDAERKAYDQSIN